MPSRQCTTTTTTSKRSRDCGGPKLPLSSIASMPTLTESEIGKLFSGAPQFFARSEGHFTGAPLPSAAFPWDEELMIRDLTDYPQLENNAWKCATAWPNMTRDIVTGPSASRGSESRRAHFASRCRERPSMLSLQGLEKGTMGYQAALEMGVADALQEVQYGYESLASKSQVIIHGRQRALTAKEGLRRLDETAVLDQLIKASTRYRDRVPHVDRASSELYHDLFCHVLHPPPVKAHDLDDPYSLTGQIQALVKVLAAPNTWIDFSKVEWRVEFGQLLWAGPFESEAQTTADGDDARPIEVHESADSGLRGDRYWLLLQILLSCELLIRLDAITEGSVLGMESLRPSEIMRFEKDVNNAVKWSLHLARAWLENIEIIKSYDTPLSSSHPAAGGLTKAQSWLTKIAKRLSFSHEDISLNTPPPSSPPVQVYWLRSKSCTKQLDGLMHFAVKLGWPDLEPSADRIAALCQSVAQGTALNPPPSMTSTISRSQPPPACPADLGGGSNPDVSPPHTPSPAARSDSWLTKHYVSGLMLPGEGPSHFLMSALLHSDAKASRSLGSVIRPNSCGFIYNGRSFWTTASVLARVLAAGKGSAECMGWVSSHVIPQGHQGGWIAVDTSHLPETMQNINKRARLWGKTTIERESDVLGNFNPKLVSPVDFMLPTEQTQNEWSPKNIISIELKALRIRQFHHSSSSPPLSSCALDAQRSSSASSTSRRNHRLSSGSSSRPPPPKTATISFSMMQQGSIQPKEFAFNLVNEVYFVTAHPCVPSKRVRILQSPSSPTIRQVDLVDSGFITRPSSSNITGHPLHKYYTYATIHLSELLERRDLSLDALLHQFSNIPSNDSTITAAKRRSTLSSKPLAKFLVIDCITRFVPLPEADGIPSSPELTRLDSHSSTKNNKFATSHSNMANTPAPVPNLPTLNTRIASGGGSLFADAIESAARKMHSETRRRQFGSDMEILVRALCAEKGWNALVSRRRRGCLACAIREAGALGWGVIIRVH